MVKRLLALALPALIASGGLAEAQSVPQPAMRAMALGPADAGARRGGEAGQEFVYIAGGAAAGTVLAPLVMAEGMVLMGAVMGGMMGGMIGELGYSRGYLGMPMPSAMDAPPR